MHQAARNQGAVAAPVDWAPPPVAGVSATPASCHPSSCSPQCAPLAPFCSPLNYHPGGLCSRVKQEGIDYIAATTSTTAGVGVPLLQGVPGGGGGPQGGGGPPGVSGPPGGGGPPGDNTNVVGTFCISTTVVVEATAPPVQPPQPQPHQQQPPQPQQQPLGPSPTAAPSYAMNGPNLAYPPTYNHHFQKWSAAAATPGLLHNNMSIGHGLHAANHYPQHHPHHQQHPVPNTGTPGQFLHSEPFHTPSFGDEEFDIPPFSLHSFSGPVSQAHQTLYSHHHTQPLSHPLPPPGSNGATRPLTHHPRTSPAFSPAGQSPHLYTNPHTPGNQPPGTNGHTDEDFVVPKFPPQNIDIPDITASNSPYNPPRSSPHQQQQQQQQHQQATYHGQFTTTGVIYNQAAGFPHPGQQQQQNQQQQQQNQQQNQQQQNHPQQHPQQQYGHNQNNNNHPGQNPGQQQQQQHNQQHPQQLNQQQVGADGHHQQQQSQQHPQKQQQQQQQGGKPGMDGRQSSPPGSTTTSPGRESSEDSDDSLPLAQLAMKRTAPESPPSSLNNLNTTTNGASATKKPKTPKKRKKKDPNEPHKPVSAYALFFRDTQAAIKGQNPNASFGEVSKIVASMWDNLDADQKSEYKKKTETAKKEYLKQLAAYRASLVSKQQHPGMETMENMPGAAMMQAQAQAQAQAQQKGMMPGMPPNMSPNMMANMSPNNMPSPPTSHMSPPHLTHLPDGHMMPHQQPMGGMHTGPHQMGVPHQQAAMSPIGGHRPQGMGSPQGPMGSPMHMNNQGHQYGMDSRQMTSPRSSMCIRNGCQNHAVSNPAWDNEYCSNACVVSHCRDVFTAWVAARQTTNSYASVK